MFPSKKSFCEALDNMTETENGAVTFKSTNSAIIDFFFHGAALRTRPQEGINLFQKAFEEDPQTALRILFYIRDIRGGQGERLVFRTILEWLGEHQCEWMTKNLSLIPEYGRWDDLFVLLNGALEWPIIRLISKQLSDDSRLIGKDTAGRGKQSISLLAKWLPSTNTSSKKTVALATKIRKGLKMTPKGYRTTLSALRRYLDVTERKMSANKWPQIVYDAVPSKAGMIYRNAFKKHDEERYEAYLKSLEKGEVKINTSTLYPYELLEKTSLYGQPDKTVDLMWKNLPDYVPNLSGLVVADTSGSMNGRPMMVSVSLAMYIAERNKNKAFKDYFISFSEKPKLHKIQGNTLSERAKSVMLGDVANTDLQAVFDLVLDRAVANNVPKEDMPKLLLIISDMEFDAACHEGDHCYGRKNKRTNFEMISHRYAAAGYDRPTLAFWNVNSRNTQSPVTINDKGVVLLSGCSPVVFKYALTAANNPMELVYNITNSERYSKITWKE